MLKGIKVQIYPSKAQEKYLASLFGSYRFVYNKCLEHKIKEYTENKKSVHLKELGKLFHGELRKNNEWLKEHNSKVLKQSIMNMLEAYKRFFVNHTGFPKFRSKNARQSVRFPAEAISRNAFKNNKVNLTKEVKNLKFRCSKEYRDLLENNIKNIKSCTLSKNKAGKYFCSFLVEVEHTPVEKTNKSVGIDLGIKTFLVSSEGEEIANPKFTRNNEKKLKTLHKRLSKKQKGSMNRKKARLALAKFWYKINCKKQDFLHKLSTKIVKDYDIIGIEDLSVKDMLKNPTLAKSIQELSLFEFTRQLTYKADWNNKLVVKVGKYFASSKTCSGCGWINNNLTLADRVFICKSCELEIDRDFNASTNIKNEALKLIGSRPSDFKPVETETLVSSVKQESNLTFL